MGIGSARHDLRQAGRRAPLARRLAVAAAFSVLALTGCSDYAVLGPNTPAAGVNAEQGQASARGLVIVANAEGQGVLTGAVLSQEDDVLSRISGVAQTASFGPAGELAVGEATIQTPADQLVSLTQKKIQVSSPELKPGLTAEITLSFEKSGDLVVTVPVMDAEHPDFDDVLGG